MVRDEAIVRIQDGLGFAHRQGEKLILRLQEAQRELEMGKTLPQFLLQQDQVLDVPYGELAATLPTGFLRIDDSYTPFFIAPGATSRTFVTIKRSITEIVQAYNTTTGFSPPTIMAIRKSTVQFATYADAHYQIFWNYYKAAQVLVSNFENEWLANAPEWLIGEAGYRMAMDVRDKDAMANFDVMRKLGRAAVFGEIIADEESSGPIIMGANL